MFLGTAIFGEIGLASQIKNMTLARPSFAISNRPSFSNRSRPSFTERMKKPMSNENKRKSDIGSLVSIMEIQERAFDVFEEQKNLEKIEEEKKFENESNSTNKLFENMQDFVDAKRSKKEHNRSSPSPIKYPQNIRGHHESLSLRAEDSLVESAIDDDNRTTEMFGNLSQNVFKSQIIIKAEPTDISVRLSNNSNPKASSSQKQNVDASSSATFRKERSKSNSSVKSALGKKTILNIIAKMREVQKKSLTNIELFTSQQQRTVYNKKKFKRIIYGLNYR